MLILEAGAADYITKPIDIKQLIAQMKKYVIIEEHNQFEGGLAG